MKKSSKWISVLLVLAMIISLFVPAMGAIATEDYSDYVPGDMPENLMKSATAYPFGGGNSSAVGVGWSDGRSKPPVYFKCTSDFALGTTETWAVNGVRFLDSSHSSGNGLVGGTSYVFSAAIKTLQGNSPKFAIAYQTGYANTHTHTLEYGTEGYAPGGEYELYRATINIPKDGYGLYAGLRSGSADDIVALDTTQGIYLGVETHYDITNVITGDSTLYAGDSTTLKSEVVNQIGIKGNLLQNITYTVLNEDRTQVITEGITVTPGEDGIATVTTDETVPTGKYVILASSEDYAGFRKGAGIYIIGSDVYYDYTPGDIPDNLFASPKAYNFNQTNSTAVSAGSYDGQGAAPAAFRVNTDFALTSSGTWPLNGMDIPQSNLTEGLKANTTYAFSASIKMESGNEPGFGIAYASGGHIHTNEYGSRGYVPGTEYETYKATITLGDHATSSLWAGLSSGTAGDVICVDYTTGMYLAPETAYDIKNIPTGTTTLLPGDSTTFRAQLVNQLEIPGTLEQDFQWAAVNTQRDAEVEGFSFVTGENGTVTVTVGDNVLPGEYVILATSIEHPRLKKGHTIKITDPDIFTEYVRGEMPQNMINGADNATALSINNGSGGTVNKFQDSNYFSWSSFLKGVSDNYWTSGPMHISTDSYLRREFVAGQSYVVSVRLKNGSPEVSPSIKFTLAVPRLVRAWTVDVASTEYQTYTGAFIAENDATYFNAGFDTGVDRSGYSAAEILYMDTKSGGSFYISEEVPYDILVDSSDASGTEYMAGDTVSLNASVINQVMTEGNLSQNFDWYALSEAKTSLVSDISLDVTSDTRGVIATLGNNIKNGTYYIVARSKDYPELVRSYELVVGALEDYVPGEIPQNMIVDPTNVNDFEKSNGAGSTRHSFQDDGFYAWAGQCSKDDYWPAGHSYFSSDEKYLNLQGSFEEGKNYIFSARLRNDAPQVNEAPIFAMSVGLTKMWSFPVTSTEFKTYTTTVTAPVDAVSTCFGFDASVDRSSLASPEVIAIDLSDGGSLYVAEEIAYDINTTTHSESTLLERGDELVVSAEALNQVGQKGLLSQKFNWQILDANKAPISAGFDLSIDESTATVTTGSRTPCGVYYLAVSPVEDTDVVKLVKFTVKLSPLKIYVAPNGSDSAEGTIDDPVTLTGAKAIVAGVTNKSDYVAIEIILRGGDYRFSETLYFTGNDSGTEETPVVYRAYEGEKPVIKGSTLLDGSKFTEVLSPDLIGRIHPDAEGKVYVTDLLEQGLTTNQVMDMVGNGFGTMYALYDGAEANGLFVDNVAQNISSWPNDVNYARRGNAIVDEVVQDSDGDDVNISTSFYYTDDEEPYRWTEAQGWYIGAYIPYDYSYARISGSSVDAENKIIKLKPHSNKTAFSITNNFSRRWKAFNLLEEIDLPGEYFLDSQNMKLYYYPTCDLEDANVEFATMFDSLINITDVSNITFRGIGFAQNNAGGVSMEDVDNIDFENCTFESLGNTGISANGSGKAMTQAGWWQRQYIDASYNVDIKGCRFYNMASTAIHISGGNVDTLTPSNNIIENNYIHGFTMTNLASSGGAITIAGVGNTVRNNHISFGNGGAIYITGNNHLVEYNEIYDVMREVQDAGAIYQGQNAIARGTIIRYNYIHDSRPLESLTHSSQVGVYLDDGQHDLYIINNIFRNIKADFNANGAAAYTFLGNTSVDVDSSWQMLNHALTKNEVVTSGPGGSLETIEAMLYDKELYFETYDELEPFLHEGTNPKKFTEFIDNITVNAGRVYFESVASNSTQDLAWATMKGYDSISDEAYSLFEDAANQDYRIKSTSQYAKDSRLTTSNFDIDDIGIEAEYEPDMEADFVKYYPAHSERVVYDSEGITFNWQMASGANKYRLVVATDPQLTNPVYDEFTRFRTATVTGLSNNTKYYWKVYAYNISGELGYEWECSDGVGEFTLSDYSGDVTFGGTTMVTEGNTTTIASQLTNNTISDNTTFTITVAAYSGDTLEYVDRTTKIIPLGSSYNLEQAIDTEGEYNIDQIKILVWKTGSIVPVCSARVLK